MPNTLLNADEMVRVDFNFDPIMVRVFKLEEGYRLIVHEGEDRLAKTGESNVPSMKVGQCEGSE